MNTCPFNERILELLIAQEFGEVSKSESSELLKLLEEDKTNGGVYHTLVNKKDKLIDHIVEFAKEHKNEETLKRAKEAFLEKMKGKQS